MPDDAIVSIISRLGVDYSQALLSTRQLASETALLDKRLKMLRVTAADLGRSAGTSISQQLLGDRIIYDQYGRTLSVAAANTKTVERATKTATQAAKEHAKGVKDLSNQYSVFGSQFERRAGWFIAGSAFFGSIAAATAAVKTISNVEMGMTQIARITEDVTFNFTEMRDELLRMGQEYGMVWDTVQDIAVKWAQAGYNVKDTLELTRSSLLALNTAELDANYATQGLIAIMSQWGMTADQLLPTIDKINKTADDWAVSSQDLVDGLNRSSGAANVLGLNLNQTIAILTVMREATGRTGKEVGNALNSILSFMQRDVALSAFAKEGIAVWADKARTQFRSVIDIFDEVAQRWPEMSAASQDMFVQAADQAGLYSEELADLTGAQKEFNDLQQRDLSQAMAGTYRRNYLLALLRNWAKVDEVLIGMEDSLGYSMKENERTMQTLEKQYEALKVSAQELAVALGDAGLLNDLKELIGGTKDVITWFNDLDPTTRNLIITFIEVTAAIKILNAVIRMAGIGGAVNLLSGWAVSATAATASTRILTGAVTGLGTVMMNVGRGALAFFGGPLGLALVAGTTAFIAFNNSAEDSQAAMEQNANAARDTANEIEKLRDRHMELAQKTDIATAEQEELKDVTSRLLELVPSAITGFDEMGNAITDMGTAAKVSAGQVALLREEHEKFIQAKAAVAESVLPGLRDQLKEQKDDREILEEAITSGPEYARVALRRGFGMPSGTFKLLDQWKTMSASSSEVHKKALDRVRGTREEIAKLTKEILDYEAAQKAAAGIGADTGDETKKKKKPPGYVGDVKDKKTTDTLKEQIKSLADAVSQFDLINQQYEASLARTGSLLSINASEYEHLTGMIEAGAATTEDYARVQELVAVRTALLQKEQEQLSQTGENYRAEIAALNPVLAEATSQYEAFQAAGDVEHMRDAAQVVSQLQDKIQSLSSTIDQNTAKWWDNQRAVMEAKQALSEDYFSRLTSWVQHMTAIGRLTLEQQIEYYKTIDLTTLSLQSQWQAEEETYNLRRQSLQEQMDNLQEAYDERMKQIEDEIEAEEEATQKKIENKEKRIDAINEETDAQIEAIQRLIDALEVEGEESDREEAERQHNQKLADLLEKKQYHELRTGLEHLKAIDDINGQMAEEERAWELKKQDWSRQDQRDAYQDQIDALRDQAKSRQDAIRQEINDIKKASNQKKKELQDYYDDIQKIVSNKTLNLLASLSLSDEQWYQRGLEWMRQLAKGIRDGQTELPSGVEDFFKEAEGERGRTEGSGTPPTGYQSPVAVFPNDDYINKNGTTYAQSRLIAERLGLPVDWDAAKGIVTIGSKSFFPSFIQNDRAYLGLRTVGQMFGYDVRFDENSGTVSYFPRAHTGAYVAGSGIAELLQGERVLSPQLTVGFDRLANVLASFPNIPDRISFMQQGYGSIDQAADRIVAAIERRSGIQIGSLFNAENVEFADQADMGIFSRELAREVNALQTARG